MKDAKIVFIISIADNLVKTQIFRYPVIPAYAGMTNQMIFYESITAANILNVQAEYLPSKSTLFHEVIHLDDEALTGQRAAFKYILENNGYKGYHFLVFVWDLTSIRQKRTIFY